jgi:hypothetical protein
MLNESNFKYTFLPPVRRDKLRGSSLAPVYTETHMVKATDNVGVSGKEQRAFLEISVDKFALLSNSLNANSSEVLPPPPPRIEQVELGGEPGKYPRSTLTRGPPPPLAQATTAAALDKVYTWNTAKMPALRLISRGEKQVT